LSKRVGAGRERADDAVKSTAVDAPPETGNRAREQSQTPVAHTPREGRAALWAFAAVEAGALVYYSVLARGQWFFADEWDFLANRSLNPKSLLLPHQGHWSTVPIVVYRVLWQLFGLRTYTPYVALTIALHLIAGALLRVILRRSGVRPWVATAGASVFVLFGAGAQEIFWAFQIGFAGSLVFGLVQVILADHAGPVDRRDWLGLAAGVLGLMCSGAYLAMAVAVGVTVSLKRGWRVAALHTAPLAVLYLGWWAHYLRHSKVWTRASSSSPSEVFAWTWRGATNLFVEIGHISAFGVALFVVLVVGTVVGWRRLDRAERRERVAVPFGFATGALAFLVTTGINRGHLGARVAESSRYQCILAALVLPALVFAVDALMQESRVLGAIALAILVLGIPGNIVEASRVAREQKSLSAGDRSIMASVAGEPLAARVPGTLRPEPNFAGEVTLAWLRRAMHAGRTPKERTPSLVEASTDRLRLSLMELDHSNSFPCRRLGRPTVVQLAKGESIGIGGTVDIALLPTNTAPASNQVAFGTTPVDPSPTHTLMAVVGPLFVRMTPTSPVDAGTLIIPDSPIAQLFSSVCQQP
jgi:hypothetical protein